MIEKKVKMRTQQKHDIEANWQKAAAFIPMKAEIIVYDIDEEHDYVRVKIGDGITPITDLPFFAPKQDTIATQVQIITWEEND